MTESTLTESTTLDPLADIAANAIDHMNEDHADTVLAYARRLAGLTWADNAAVTGLDAGGIEIAVRGNGLTQLVRIPFEPRLTEAAQLPIKESVTRPIDLDLVAQVLEAANWAPSHGKTEPWRFVVFSGSAPLTTH